VKQFFVEVFTARATAGKLATAERRARSAAKRLSSADREVQFVRATYIPEDEICFFVFDAPSGHDAALAAERAGLEPTRVVEAMSSPKEEQ
jgi:hypothetical protein